MLFYAFKEADKTGDGPIAHVGTGLTIGAGATVKEGAKVFDSVKEGEEVC